MANIFGIDAGNLLKNLGGEGLTDQERKRALAFGLLHLGAGTLANNRGHYGAFGPAAGAGLTQGLLGYQAQLGREEAGAKARKQAEILQRSFSGAISQPTIPGQEKQGFSVGSNWSEDQGTADFLSNQARDYNDLQAQTRQGAETFPLMPDAPLVNSQLLPGMNRPEPLEDYNQEELVRQMMPKTPPSFSNALKNVPMRNQDEMIVPKTVKGPDTLGLEQFDMLQAARLLMQSGEPEMMQKGFEIYAGLKGEGGEEFGTTPFIDAEGNVIQFGKKGSFRQTGLKGQPKEGGKLGDIDVPLANGQWQIFQRNADGSPNMDKPIGVPFSKRPTASEVNATAKNESKQESKQSEAYGTDLGKWRGEIQKQGFTAKSKLNSLSRMETLLKDVDGGRLAKPGMAIASAANSFGIKIDPKLGDKEAAQSLAIEMALSMREPGTGPMTDKDFDNFLLTVPDISKTAEGRAAITATLKAKAKRDIEIAKMARDFAEKNNGVINDKFLDMAMEYIIENPVIKTPGSQYQGFSIVR